MSTYQQITIVGHIGQDPEMRFTTNGQAILNFSVAVNNRGKKNQEQEPDPTWYRCTMFGERANRLSTMLEKGYRVTVTGDFEHRSFVRQDGTPGCACEIIVREMDFTGNRSQDDDNGYQRQERQPRQSARPAAQRQMAVSLDDDEVPF